MKTMTGNGEFGERPSVTKKMIVVLLATASLLLVPLVAMQFTSEVKWDLLDFIAAGVLLAGTGTVYVLSTPRVPGALYREIVAAVLTIALLFVWAQLVVGIFGS
jgi:hypothetical protein